MRENGIHARHKRRYTVTMDSKHGLPVAPNLLDRNFAPTAPNQVWTSDITYLWTDEGWLYLAIVLDPFNREVVGWSLKPRMTADIVTDALTMAWFHRKPAPGLMHHSDRELVQQLQERAGARHTPHDARGNDGGNLRVYRGVLQPETVAFHPRLQVANPVLERLDQHSI